MVALPLTAVLALHASPAELALIAAAQALPILLLSLPVGAWIDRRAARWPLLFGADVGRAAILTVVPVAGVAGWLSIPLLAAIAFALSVGGTVFDLAYAGWLPRILSGDDLHRANARVELARSSSVVIGPAAGGALVGALTAPIALLADAASFLASAVLVASVRRSEAWIRDVAVGSGPRGIRGELATGIRFILGQPLVLAVTATAGINNLSRSIAMGVAVLYLVDVAHLDPTAIGLWFAVGNVGFIGGALLARRVTATVGMGNAMQLGVALFGPAMLGFALAPPELAGPAFALMLFANGLGISIHNVNQLTVRQLLTPDALRARVAAVFRLVIFGAIPVGTAIGGLIGETVGLRAAMVVSGAGLLLGSLPYAAVRIRRLRSVAELQVAPAAR